MNRPHPISTVFLLLLISQASVAQQSSGPREQLNQDVAHLRKNPSDDALREKIIKLALTLEPKPAIPPEADELAGRAKYIFEHVDQANSKAGFLQAADAYVKISLVAPWFPDYYYNAAVAYEKGNNPAEAVKNYKWYLIAAPDAQDARDVRGKIGALTYVLEQKEAAAAAEHARRDAELEAVRTREQEARQARERAEEERTQRLTKIDPLIRSLNGATYYVEKHYRDGGVCTARYTVTEDIVLEETGCQNPDVPRSSQSTRYPIQGQSFYMDANRYAGGNFCKTSVYRADECGYVGTITEKGISFQFVADGTKRQRLVAGPSGDYIPRQ